MTRKEAIKNIKEHCYFANLIPQAKEALDIAIASLTIDEKYDLEFARSEADIDLVGYRKTMMDSFDKRR